MKKNKGITLIALVITIILLLILAGIVLNLTLGQNGIINLAKNAKNEYENAEKNEIKDLDKLYSSIKIANGSTITLTQEELDEYIKTKASPTGIKTDTFICNVKSSTTAYTGATSMNGFTRTADENNKISTYLSYSDEYGYTVLKSGWYYIITFVETSGTVGNTNIFLDFYLNGMPISGSSCKVIKGTNIYDRDGAPMFLNEGDKVYFECSSNGGSAQPRNAEAYIYPMF